MVDKFLGWKNEAIFIEFLGKFYGYSCWFVCEFTVAFKLLCIPIHVTQNLSYTAGWSCIFYCSEEICTKTFSLPSLSLSRISLTTTNNGVSKSRDFDRHTWIALIGDLVPKLAFSVHLLFGVVICSGEKLKFCSRL